MQDATSVRDAMGYPCEVCHSRRATTVFDKNVCCAECRLLLEQRLEAEKREAEYEMKLRRMREKAAHA